MTAGDATFYEFTIQIFGIGVTGIHFFGVFPIYVVQLDLYEVPFQFVMSG